MLFFRIFFIYTVFIFLGCAETSSSNGQGERPNIIYILADDLGYGELGVYGQTKIETPNIDNLAETGMLFTQHYSGAPVCAPSRAVLLTGQHTGHTYIRGNDEWSSRGDVRNYRAMIRDSTLEGQRPLPKNTQTIGKLMQRTGYKTGIIGKWGLGAPHTHSTPTQMGFDYFFGYNCQRQAHTYYPVHLYENDKRYYLDNDTIRPNLGLADDADSLARDSYQSYSLNEYSETVSFQKLMNFIERNKKDPFFLYWASPIPHLPLQAPQRWVDYYVDKFGDEKPYVFRQENGGSYYPCRYPRATYAAMISYLDENIGKLISYLKEEGMYDNTLIVFTSDNGPSYLGGTDSPWFDSGGPFPSNYGRGKGFLYEGGIRVPFIASWPNKIPQGSSSDYISTFYDMLPTFCDITGINKPTATDGVSIYNTLLGKEEKNEKRDYIYWEFPAYGGQVAIRYGKWKVIWKDIKKGNKNIEVYNLEMDIAETNNLADEMPEMIEKFKSIVKKEHKTPTIEKFIMQPLEELCNS